MFYNTEFTQFKKKVEHPHIFNLLNNIINTTFIIYLHIAMYNY